MGFVTRGQIEAAKTPAGGWTKATLAKWGVPWPPPKGWKKELEKSGTLSQECVTPTQEAYREFLRTPEWKIKRDQRVKQDSYRCQHCGTGEKLDVHHLNYDNPWGCEKMTDLLTLCRKCHYQEHERVNVSNELIPVDNSLSFDFAGHPVRVVMIEDEPWWVAGDVCAVLGLSDTHKAMERIDEDDRSSTPVIDTLGRSQTVNIVNESGLYDLTLGSRKPEAKTFKRWVTREVLPQIRKTGTYGIENVSRLDLAKMIVAAEEELEAARIAMIEAEQREEEARQRSLELQETLAVTEPDANAWRGLAATGETWLVEEAAKFLCRDPETYVTAYKLRRFMNEEWDLLTKQRDRPFPKKYALENGLLEVRPIKFYYGNSGREGSKEQIRVTFQGVKWMYEKLGGKQPMQEIMQEDFPVTDE